MSTAASKTPSDDSSGVTNSGGPAGLGPTGLGPAGINSSGGDQSGITDSKRKPSRKKDPLIGKTINGRFTILDVIARGGMGKVYRAEQSPLGRICALKVLNPRYDGEEDPEFQKRFFLEASTAAKLSHANTVTIFDYGRDEDIYYIAMEYIQGRTLYRMLRDDGPMDEVRVAHVMKQVARSLREAHGLGVIHRDMKPANVVLVDNGDEADTVKVLDFGLVKETGEDTEDLTQQGLFMGSPKYMAPEQILGNSVSAATDVYAIGVVAFELLSGRVPFDEGASVKTLMAHVNDTPPGIYDVYPEAQVSPQMEAIVSRCLMKKATDRYESMDELLRALTSVQGGGAMTESLRQAPLVTTGLVTADMMRASQRSPSWSGPLESGPVSLRSRHSSLPDIPAPMAIPDGAPSETSNTLPSLSLTGAPLVEQSLAAAVEPAKEVPASGGAGKLIAAAVGVLLLIGAGGYLFLSSASPPAGQSSPGQSSPAQVDSDQSKPALAPATSGAQPNGASAKPSATEASGDTDPSANAAAAMPRVVRISTEPQKAQVKEGNKVLCRATPCEVTFADETAEAGKGHKLVLIKQGYVSQELRINASAVEAKGKLRRVAVRRTQPVSKPTPKPVDNSGYKASPY